MEEKILLQFAIVAVVLYGTAFLLKHLRPHLPAKSSGASSGDQTPEFWKREMRESVRQGVRQAMEEVIVPALDNNTESNKDLAKAIGGLSERLAVIMDRTGRGAGAGAS